MLSRKHMTVATVFVIVQIIVIILIASKSTENKLHHNTNPRDYLFEHGALFDSQYPEQPRHHKDAIPRTYAIIGLDLFPNLIKTYNVPKRNSTQIPRVTTPFEYDTLMNPSGAVAKILTNHNISFALGYGSLVGSYFMHDLLPWDDDVDIMIANSTKAKVMDIFSSGTLDIQGYHHYKHGGSIFKVFFNDSNFSGKYPWKWPFIDIRSYREVGTNIKAVERHKNLTIPVHSFYPFHLRPFGPIWLPVPKNPWVLLNANYPGNFQCVSTRSNHKTEKGRKIKARPCSQLQRDYAFVKRSQYGNRTVESLVLDDRKLYEIVVDEPYRDKRMFKW